MSLNISCIGKLILHHLESPDERARNSCYYYYYYYYYCFYYYNYKGRKEWNPVCGHEPEKVSGPSLSGLESRGKVCMIDRCAWKAKG